MPLHTMAFGRLDLITATILWFFLLDMIEYGTLHFGNIDEIVNSTKMKNVLHKTKMSHASEMLLALQNCV